MLDVRLILLPLRSRMARALAIFWGGALGEFGWPGGPGGLEALLGAPQGAWGPLEASGGPGRWLLATQRPGLLK